MTVNPVSKLDSYPIPNVEDLFVKLKVIFSKIDLATLINSYHLMRYLSSML